MEHRPVPSSLRVFWLVLLYLPVLQVLADQTIYIQLSPRFNATPVIPPDPACPANPDQRLQILLTPAVTGNQTAAPNNFGLCGVDETVDQERLLSEWNGPYVFDFLNQKDSQQKFRTQVYSVIEFTTSGEIATTTMTTTTTTTTARTTTTSTTTTTTSPTSTEDPIKETSNTTATTLTTTHTTTIPTATTTRNLEDDEEHGLFSLFISPPTSNCNNAALESAANGEAGFYSVFIGLSNNFSAQKTIFMADAECLKNEFGGKKPKLCGTKLLLSEMSGKSRLATMEGIFNFPYNWNRRVRPNTLKQCETRESTKESIAKSSFFDTTSPMWFKSENTTVVEANGFANIKIYRNEKMGQKAVGYVKTDISQDTNAASKADFVQYDGPVVFEKNKSTTEVIVDLKKDNLDEQEEFFMLSIKTSSEKRRKRMTIDDVCGLASNNIIVWIKDLFEICDYSQNKHSKCTDIKPICENKFWGKCQECINANQCKERDKERPMCKINKGPEKGQCVQCLTHKHCPTIDKSKCSDEEGSCEACEDHSTQCQHLENTPICLGSKCTCENGPLKCPLLETTPHCKEGKCVACLNDNHCGEGRFCNMDGTCGGCESNIQCTNPETSWCQVKTGICKKCNKD